MKTQLQHIIQQDPASIRAYVAQEALDYNDDDPTLLFFDLLTRCGCQGGTISSLIYYSDTHAFFEAYYDEIEQLREDHEDSIGEPLTIQGDLKNWLAWFAFEATAWQIAQELGLEI